MRLPKRLPAMCLVLALVCVISLPGCRGSAEGRRSGSGLSLGQRPPAGRPESHSAYREVEEFRVPSAESANRRRNYSVPGNSMPSPGPALIPVPVPGSEDDASLQRRPNRGLDSSMPARYAAAPVTEPLDSQRRLVPIEPQKSGIFQRMGQGFKTAVGKLRDGSDAMTAARRSRPNLANAEPGSQDWPENPFEDSGLTPKASPSPTLVQTKAEVVAAPGAWGRSHELRAVERNPVTLGAPEAVE